MWGEIGVCVWSFSLFGQKVKGRWRFPLPQLRLSKAAELLVSANWWGLCACRTLKSLLSVSKTKRKASDVNSLPIPTGMVSKPACQMEEDGVWEPSPSLSRRHLRTKQRRSRVVSAASARSRGAPIPAWPSSVHYGSGSRRLRLHPAPDVRNDTINAYHCADQDVSSDRGVASTNSPTSTYPETGAQAGTWYQIHQPHPLAARLISHCVSLRETTRCLCSRLSVGCGTTPGRQWIYSLEAALVYYNQFSIVI